MFRGAHNAVYGRISTGKVHNGATVEVAILRHDGCIVVGRGIRTFTKTIDPLLYWWQFFALKKREYQFLLYYPTLFIKSLALYIWLLLSLS